jgi:hypothetical protein
MDDDYFDELVSKYDNQTKLDVAAWVISKIDNHGNNPGSFRHLIYTLMGFGPEAYVPLYEAGGMNITNELDYNMRDQLASIIKDQGLDNVQLKTFALLCDEPGCYTGVSCGFPTDNGYRRTCYEHSSFKEANNDVVL